MAEELGKSRKAPEVPEITIDASTILEKTGIDPAVNTTLPKNVADLATEAGQLQGRAIAVAGLAEMAEQGLIQKLTVGNIESLIALLDDALSAQVAEIMHVESFKKVERTWRSLEFVVGQTNFAKNVEIEILDCSPEELGTDQMSGAYYKTALYRKIYSKLYDQLGGRPYGVVVSGWEVKATDGDMTTLSRVAQVCQEAHLPFVASVTPEFFGLKSMGAFNDLVDLRTKMKESRFAAWSSFRKKPEARYVGLTLPRFKLRPGYSPDSRARASTFRFKEFEGAPRAEDACWGAASYALVARMIKSFEKFGMPSRILGLKSGGSVGNLPLEPFDTSANEEMKIPIETQLDDTRALTLSDLGFIPLIHHANTDEAVFYYANSAQEPADFIQAKDAADARLGSRLPYLMTVSRVAHLLKAMARYKIGTTTSAVQLEEELQAWLNSYTTKDFRAGEEQKSKWPFRESKVSVSADPRRPGEYRMELELVPHMFMERLDGALKLTSYISKEPKGN